LETTSNIHSSSTADGSDTVMSDFFGENYHSHFGAVTESKHVYLKSGYCYSDVNPVKVLELGLGTGLNLLMTAIESLTVNRLTHYTSIEKFPIQLDQVLKLNYTQFFDNQFNEYYRKIHQSEWHKRNGLNDYFTFEKVHSDWISYKYTDTYDVVYYDAFSPETQPELWTVEIFQKVYNALNINAILVTYCAKGQVRRNLQAASFTVERLQGPIGGKREILRAIKH
jgi:tRNA U34 5-methylaminomethyl-2-thiouridine-forming methyltransferase MnmC